ncbi:SAM-dependent methyltransferase [Streptomyces sp. CA-294286]|uniref:SAM-dependent methyltransferase n=1 Tax=Streptomyces sp. CA-294286 TaxID=3240070 RepID=UPI003D8AFE8E
MNTVSLLAPRGSALDQALYDTASSARLYEFLLGGTECYEADREAAFAVYATAEWVKTAALINRDFSLRSVEFSLGLGVRQFVDLGCGLPGFVNVHEIADKLQPRQPVVYVDRDPLVYAHARSHLDARPGVSVIHADILAMDRLLTCDVMRAAVDLNEPVAVLLHDVLSWCTDDEAVKRAMAILRAWLPSGSTLSISHLTDHWHPATMPAVVATYAQHGMEVRPRSREEIAELFGDFVQSKGLVATGKWHGTGRWVRHREEHSAAFAGIAVKPAPRPSGVLA